MIAGMRMISLILPLLLLAAPAEAGDGKKSGKGDGPANRVYAAWSLDKPDEADIAPPDDGRGVEVPNLVVPVTRDGRLETYVFVSVRLHVAPGVDPWRVRGRAHYIRDAMVRAAHRDSLAGAETAFDRGKAESVWRAAANDAFGEDWVDAVYFLTVDERT